MTPVGDRGPCTCITPVCCVAVKEYGVDGQLCLSVNVQTPNVL